MESWISKLQASASGSGIQPGLSTAWGIRLLVVEPGKVKIEMSFSKEEMGNPVGGLHGGVLCTVADHSMGYAFLTLLEGHQSFVTVDFNIQFIRAPKGAVLIAEGELIRKSRKFGFMQSWVKSDDGEIVAKANSTCYVLSPPEHGRPAS